MYEILSNDDVVTGNVFIQFLSPVHPDVDVAPTTVKGFDFLFSI